MDFRMETFVKQHKAFLLDKIASYKPPVSHNKDISNASSSDITIVARVRPLLENEIADGSISSVVVREPKFVDVHELRQKINHQPALLSANFHLDKVYGPSGSSEALYDDLMKPLVQWAWAGGVGTLFAYGQTGSGKTYSINGLERLTAAELMSGTLKGKREVYISVCELVGNAAFDLLNDHRSINVLEDSFGETQLVGALEQKPATADEFLSLIETSMTFRKTVPTVKNDTSSRSHAVCRIRIVNKDVVGLPDGLLFVVDLAGSEMASDIKDHSAERMKETREINVSLSVLKDCIRGRALASMMEGTVSANKKVHVPFRSSGLTKVLKNLFDINSERGSKTAVLACVKPLVSDVVASRNTLRYAELLRVPIQKAKLLRHNISAPRTWTNKALQEWIKTNSGESQIDPSILAPTENGTQICRLPKGEFISRCQKTPGVTVEHAQAFYGKLWLLHIDSRTDTGTNTPTEESTAQESRPVNNTPFKERLKPGMYVRRKPTWHGQNDLIVMILCPEHAFENPGELVKEESPKRYICAQILPAIMHGAYDLHLTSQRVIALEDMETEVLMEYDVATRYFYMTL